MNMREFAYLLSPSYSGSTLLTFLIARHPRIATIGELKATARGDISQYRCSCGEFQLQCAFWKTLGERLKSRGVDFDIADFKTHFRLPRRPLADRLVRARLRSGAFERLRETGLRAIPGAMAELARIGARNRALADAICDIQQADLFLDGSKEPGRLRYLLRYGFPAPRVIHLVRDGRAVTNSALGHEYESPEIAARDWRRTHEEAFVLQRELGRERFFTLRYEDFCRKPDDSLRTIFEFLKLDPAQAQSALPRPQHILGNAMRLRPNSGEIKLDEKWRNSLSAVNLALFERIGGGLNRKFGYE